MNLRVVGANLVVNVKSFYREKTTMFFTIAFPIILILVFGTIFMNQDNVSFHLCVQDLDQTNSSAQSIKTLTLNGKFKITQVDPAVNATQYVRDNKVNLVLVIPKGYEKSLMQRMEFDDLQRIRHPHVYIRPQLFFGVHEDADPELGVRRDKPGAVREVAVHQVGPRNRYSPRNTGSSSSSSPASSRWR